MTLDRAFEAALTAQDACNLSGVVFSYAEAMQAVCNEAQRQGKGTDWKNQHPISVLFAGKIASLTRVEENYSQAYQVVTDEVTTGSTEECKGMTFSEQFDNAVGDVNATVSALKSLIARIQEVEANIENTDADGDIDTTRSDLVQEQIDLLQAVIDFDIEALDAPEE